MKREYKVDDKVKIREDLRANHSYGNIDTNKTMPKYRGKIATITARFPDGSYVLDIDRDYCSWTPEMFDQNWKEDKFMKTSEFKAELEKLGYTFEGTHVINEQNSRIAWVSSVYVNSIDTHYSREVSPKLFNLITKYAATPIDEREDEKLFNVQIIKGNWGRESWLYRVDYYDEISTSSAADNNDDNQQWTVDQIKEYGIDDEEVYKRVPVED